VAIGGAVVVGVVLALVAGVMLAPDTGGSLPEPPPPVDLPDPVQVRAAPSPAPSAPPPPKPPIDPDILPEGSLIQKVAPRPPVDPDKVYDVEQRGIATALFERQPRLASCYMDHVDSFGPVDGRPTVRMTVRPEPDEDGNRVDIHIENQGMSLDSLDACLAEAMADAQFGDIDIPSTVLQPIPLPSMR